MSGAALLVGFIALWAVIYLGLGGTQSAFWIASAATLGLQAVLIVGARVWRP